MNVHLETNSLGGFGNQTSFELDLLYQTLKKLCICESLYLISLLHVLTDTAFAVKIYFTVSTSKE